ncbi:MAG: site-specific DNA-methyltransferase [Thermoproteota archaeon]|nr:site-specific DNA-methyltransferase [Thermoproteota archaeon]
MKRKEVSYKILQGDCVEYLKAGSIKNIHLTFFDPPYNQGKDYDYFDDEQDPERYWGWIKEIFEGIRKATVKGGAIYFMQREKNTEFLLNALREAGWTFQNLIIWRKKTSAIPSKIRFGKSYQVIAFATKGKKSRVFNRLRINPPLPPSYKYERENGMFTTDVWTDIRELTSGYFAGDEALRDKEGNRIHLQQSPVALLLRIILSSSLPGDTVFDPMAGTGTALVTAYQLNRNSIGIEIDPNYVKLINRRLRTIRSADDVSKYYGDYEFTPNLEKIWGTTYKTKQKRLLYADSK